ncbi:MAG: hypothetical protein EOM46_19445 [Gammaproteobacteria bacterium]|uniref:PIN-like domain-containing protein n=1 Tax=Tolumonas osonensis TaxID=675874 RepID=A0A841GEG8_9GAMM|nr:hypothetical protein [Tolumonas osonensis]MBB6055967.1 hypothetical protein [Tolumonas osonensis]NCB59602.1 hypothetical protein [Gammaproteobacteria bacterium]
MPKNILIVIEQAVNKCLDMDLTKFNQLEIVVSASQKSLPVEFVKELLRIQVQCGSPVELLTTKGTGGHHVEMYLAWLLGRHIEKTPDANITVIADNIDAESLLGNCIDEEYHDRICIIQGDADVPKSEGLKLEKPAQKKAPIETAVAEEKVKQADNKLISKLMERQDILEARHPITGEPLPSPLNN